jgi:FlaG/FlaF family flagellin (archaellin)
VLGLGDQAQQATPQASFSWDYDGDGPEVTITHDGGDTIQADELHVRGVVDDSSNSIDKTWGSYTSTGSEITAGDRITVDDSNLNGYYDLRVVYEPIEGDTSATLAQDTGPEA